MVQLQRLKYLKMGWLSKYQILIMLKSRLGELVVCIQASASSPLYIVSEEEKKLAKKSCAEILLL
jgi:hypothetical protein